MQLSSGSRLGPYEVVSRLGAGGMGEVFRARDTRLEREVAIKVLPSQFAGDANLRARFEREAKTISQLTHPHICTLHDIGRESGIDFLVMELLDGESLADRIARGPLPLHEVLLYGAQIADALSKAHRHGVVHRDLKPGNVMITKSGAKLLDFGLAKPVMPQVGSDSTTVAAATARRPLTAEGMIVGTFQYMAPEQLEGFEADARTDIFALGCVLYEMVTGCRAFDGQTRTSLMAAIVSSQPRRMSELQPVTPPALEHVVDRCLQKDPDARWQSAQDIAEELRWTSRSGTAPAVAAQVVTKSKVRERLGWIAALVTVAAISAAVATRLSRPEPGVSYRFTIPMAGNGYRLGQNLHMSPDGKAIAFDALTADGHTQLMLQRLDEFRPHAIEGTVGGKLLDWSRDSRSLLFRTGAKLMRVSVGGGAPEPMAEVPPVASAAWSPRGDVVFGQQEGPLLHLAPGATQVEPMTTLDPKRFERGHNYPHFLPDGETFLFITFTRDPSRLDAPKSLYAGRLGSKEIRRIGDITSDISYARNLLFWVRNGTLVAAPFDAKKLAITGPAQVVADDVWYFQPTGATEVGVSDDGTIVTAPMPSADRMEIVDAAGRSVSTLRAGTAFGPGLAVTRDQSQVIAAVQDRSIGTFDLWSFGLKRPTATQLTFDPTWESCPALSPDGKTVYYSNDRKGVPDIYAKTLDSAEPDHLVLEERDEQYARGVTPDGRLMLYETRRDDATKQADLYILPLTGGAPQPFVSTPASEQNASLSPDGRWAVYESDISGRYEIYVKPFPGPGPAQQISTNGGTFAAWTPDSRGLTFVEGESTVMSSSFENGVAGDPRQLFTTSDRISQQQPLSAGRHLVILTNDAAASAPARIIVRWPDTIGK